MIRHPQPARLALLLALTALPTTCGDRPGAEPATSNAAPRVRLRLSGAMEGWLEPCGCASGQLGGLPRRMFQLNEEHNYDLLIEGGNAVEGGTPLDVEKLRTALMILSMMPPEPYHALAIGPADLQLPLEDLTQIWEMSGIPAISSDLVAGDNTTWLPRPFLEQQAGDAVVRIAALTLSMPSTPTSELLRLRAPADAWQAAMSGVANETYRILLVHGTPEQVREQATLEPRPDLIVGISDLVAEPPAAAEPVHGVPVVYPGTRGRVMLDVVLARIDGAPQVTQYRVIALRASETAKGALEDRNTKLALLAHRQQVKADNILALMAEQEPTPNGALYVGSDQCADCHEETFESWQKTSHANAWQTLEKAESGTRYGWPVTAYPDCVRCHVVGYGQKSGFVDPDKTPQLRGVGCEQCHGPGSEHIESGGETARIPTGAGDCTKCHDFDQSPGFADDYNARWKKIEHY